MILNNFSTKICRVCKVEKALTEFHGSKINKEGLRFACKECNNKRNREYKKTKKGVVAAIYSDQRSRSKKRGHVMPDYTNIELRKWLFSQDKFHRLFELWKESGYLTSEKPSCDRLDDYKPYTFDNLQIMTWQENNDKGQSDRKNGINNKDSKAVIQIDLDGGVVAEHHSIKQAERLTGTNNGHISKCCKGKRKTAGGYKWSYA